MDPEDAVPRKSGPVNFPVTGTVPWVAGCRYSPPDFSLRSWGVGESGCLAPKRHGLTGSFS